MTEEEYPTAKVRLTVDVDVTFDHTDTDSDIKQTASMLKGKGTVTDAQIVEKNDNSG